MSESGDGTVFVVDDNLAVRRSVASLMQSAGLAVQTFASAAEFLSDYDPQRTACLLLDLRLGQDNGLDLQDKLRQRHADLPIIVVTGHGTLPASVRAMKAGAIDFLQKPVPPETLLVEVRRALDLARRRRVDSEERAAVRARLELLTARERDVMHLLITGKSSKQIAAELQLSVRTVEGYRGAVLKKLRAASAADLVRLVLPLESELEAKPGRVR